MRFNPKARIDQSQIETRSGGRGGGGGGMRLPVPSGGGGKKTVAFAQMENTGPWRIAESNRPPFALTAAGVAAAAEAAARVTR